MEDLQAEQQKEIDDKKTKIEDKLTKAAERRDGVIEQVKTDCCTECCLEDESSETSARAVSSLFFLTSYVR